MPGTTEGFVIRQSPLDGVTRLYTYRRAGAFPLSVTVGLDLVTVLAPAHSTARLLLWMATIATIILIVLKAYMTREVRTRIAHEAALVEGQKLLESANAELIASKERAEAGSRAKSLFLANMSHELRTPLNAVIGFAEIIRDQTYGPTAMARYSDYAKDIAESGHHLLGVISGILNIAKIEAGKAVLSEQVVSLPEIVDTAVTAVRAQAALKRLDFQAEIPERLPYLMADPTQLVQIAINLLSNAVKFTPKAARSGSRSTATSGAKSCCRSPIPASACRPTRLCLRSSPLFRSITR